MCRWAGHTVKRYCVQVGWLTKYCVQVDWLTKYCVQVDWLTKNMRNAGFAVASLHSDMKQKERDALMRDFRSGASRVLITTDLFARGIDVQQVRSRNNIYTVELLIKPRNLFSVPAFLPLSLSLFIACCLRFISFLLFLCAGVGDNTRA